MTRFASAQEAKEFLVSQIVDEARREGVPLSEVERKMLYFSETGWTLPDIMEVNDKFDREYDQSEYEKKISGLIRNALKRARAENPEEDEAWSEAIRTLEREDHYVLVMVGEARASIRPPGDQLKLFITALVIVGGVLAGAFLSEKYGFDWGKRIPSKAQLQFVIWVTLAAVAGVAMLLRFLVGRQRFESMFVKTVENLFGPFVSKK